ncbi:AAA family ATPase [Candidatus Palauibacter sp.]|uniref:AAA family ATPase n=1 Tax=Candidatus Palauibacter sp. TaxID=3101350 RepID=UPI003B52767A
MSGIRAVAIEGFKSFKALRDLPLRSLNVLIGANGSGKSNFLDACELMRLCLIDGRAFGYVQRAGGADRLLHFGSKVTTRIEFQIKFQDVEGDYKIRMRHGGGDQLNPGASVPVANQTKDFANHHLNARSGAAPLLDSFRNRLEDWRRYHFHDTSSTSPIKKTADIHDNRHLRRDGSNLAPFLYLLRSRHRRDYDLIRQTVRLVAPFLEDFQLEPLALNEDKIRLEWRHVGSDAYFDASSLSDGSLRFIALATVLLQPLSLRPSLILLDEPELGLHPTAVKLLASLLKQASVDSQIVVATQSPFLLDHFEPEDVLVADRVEGATTLTRLDPERLGSWLEDYSLGQLWEKNELGGRPSPRAG